MSSDVRVVLDAAWALIEQRSRWTQYVLAEDVRGFPCDSDDPAAVHWCAVGALERACGRDRSAPFRPALMALNRQARALYSGNIGEVNDSMGYTAVTAVYRAARKQERDA